MNPPGKFSKQSVFIPTQAELELHAKEKNQQMLSSSNAEMMTKLDLQKK
jgi:hypothetical protein